MSVLSFAPIRSRISQQFLPQFQHITFISAGKAADWPALLIIITRRTSSVVPIAFPPDSERIISGSKDMTVCVWDAETGAMVCGPFRGHTGEVASVAFSHTDTRIAFGSYNKTVCIRDLETRAMVFRPYQVHTEEVTSIAFSRDSKYVVFGSYDNTIEYGHQCKKIWSIY